MVCDISGFKNQKWMWNFFLQTRLTVYFCCNSSPILRYLLDITFTILNFYIYVLGPQSTHSPVVPSSCTTTLYRHACYSLPLYLLGLS